MRSLIAAALTAAFAGIAPAAIINGSFETGSNPPGSGFTTLGSGSTAMTGWTVGGSGTSVDWIGGYWQPSNGLRSIDLSGGYAGSLSQTFTTTPGQTYTVTFDMAGNPDGGSVIKSLIVSAAADSQTYSFDTTGWNRFNMGWTGQTFQFTATGSSTTLTFTSNELNAFGPALDNVVVLANAVPEPISLVVFGGIVIAGITLSRRRMLSKG